MMNCTLSTFGFILFVMAFISYYQYCSLSSSLQRIQCMQIWCRFAPRSIESSYFREQKKKKKERASGIQCLFCYPVLPMAQKRANKFEIATNLIQLHKVLRFCTIYLQFFHAPSFVATVHGL